MLTSGLWLSATGNNEIGYFVTDSVDSWELHFLHHGTVDKLQRRTKIHRGKNFNAASVMAVRGKQKLPTPRHEQANWMHVCLS